MHTAECISTGRGLSHQHGKQSDDGDENKGVELSSVVAKVVWEGLVRFGVDMLIVEGVQGCYLRFPHSVHSSHSFHCDAGAT